MDDFVLEAQCEEFYDEDELEFEDQMLRDMADAEPSFKQALLGIEDEVESVDMEGWE